MPDDPKKPRGRDFRRPITPPAGVRAQTAPPESWDELSEITPRNIEAIDPKELERMDREKLPRRVAQTKQLALDAVNVSQSTLDAVTGVRAELKDDIKRIERKQDEHGSILGDVRENVAGLSAKVSGEIRTIRDFLEEDRDERRGLRRVRMTAIEADVEVKKTDGLAQVEVEKTRALAKIEVRKTYALKTIAAVAAVWGFVTTYILASLHC